MSRWVFLRGLTREAGHWGNFPGIFENHFPSAEIILFDLPGNGSRHAETSPLSVEALAEDCRSRILGDDTSPICLLAMSLGAMVAAAWAARYPNEISACVLINTSLRGINPPGQRLQSTRRGELLRLMRCWNDPLEAERLILSLTSNDIDQRRCEQILDCWIDIRRRHPVSRANAFRQLIAALRFRAPELPPSMHKLVLCGKGDRLVAPDCSKALAAFWNCPIACHESAGHDLPLDAPVWLAQQVAEWHAQLMPPCFDSAAESAGHLPHHRADVPDRTREFLHVASASREKGA